MTAFTRSTRRSLARSWRTMLLVFCAAALLLGVGSIALAQFQRSMFEDTTAHFIGDVHELLELHEVIRGADDVISPIYYEFGSPEALEGRLEDFATLDRTVKARLAALHRHETIPGYEMLVARAESRWAGVARSVEQATLWWGTDHVQTALAQGSDPFVEGWTDNKAAGTAVTELAELIVDSQSGIANGVSARVGRLMPLLAAIVAIMFALGWLGMRRISRDVIAPIMTARRTLHRMEAGELDQRVEIRSRYAELTELAEGLNGFVESLASSQEQLRLQASKDHLTGLWNGRALTERLEEIGAHGGDDEFALLYIDLDGFKEINDSLGHSGGDELLRIVSERLRHSTREEDFIARLGGDEFAVVVPANPQGAAAGGLALARRMLAALEAPVTVAGRQVRAGCSIGVATGRPEAGWAQELVRHADQAMYAAKDGGKGTVELYATESCARTDRLDLKTDLFRAVERQEFALHYQPVIDVRTTALLGFEALVRWQHPQRGLVPPLDFIALAEETGDIHALGAWVLRQACQDLHALSVGKPQAGDLWVSVNVSPRQLSDERFARDVATTLSDQMLAPRHLMVEVTEAAVLADPDAASRALRSIRALGVRVALDDFGTGFSSLRHLQQLPVDVLKIDRSFTQHSPQAGGSDMVLDAVVGLGFTLGLDVIAEGIEEPVQMDRLRSMGPLAGQGYLIARPMPLAEAVAFAHASARLRPVQELAQRSDAAAAG